MLPFYQELVLTSIQIFVKVFDDISEQVEVPLIAELAYVCSKLHRDTFHDIEIDHNIHFAMTNSNGEKTEMV